MIKKILVIRIDGIGDLLCVTPMLHSLRSLFPQASIDMLANLGPHTVLNGNPDIDRLLIDYRTKVAGSRWKGLCYLPTRFARLIAWKTSGYDLVIVAHYGIHQRALQLARSIRTPQIIASVEPEFQQTIQDARVRFVPYTAGLHEVEGVQSTLSPWTAAIPGRMWLHPDRPAVCGTKFVVGLNLTSSVPERLWPQVQFSALLETLANNFPDIEFRITGNPDDVRTFEHEFSSSPSSLLARTSFTHTRSLDEFINAVAQCDLFISSDGGGVHIASALHVPQVALFQNLSSKLVRWHPWAVPYAVVHADTDGAAVPDISLKQVVEAASHLIQALLAKRAIAAS